MAAKKTKKVQMGGAVRAKIKPFRGPALPTEVQALINDLRAERREEQAALRSILGRIAEALEDMASANHKSLALHKEQRDDSKNLNDWARASFLISAEERGFTIEENLEGRALPIDMEESEWREFVRRQLTLRSIQRQEEAAAQKKPEGES